MGRYPRSPPIPLPCHGLQPARSGPKQCTYNPGDRYTHPQPVSTVSSEAHILGAPGSRRCPSKQLTCMQGLYTLHASVPEGLARPTILPNHSHPHAARIPPPLTLAVPGASTPPGRTQSHLQKSLPLRLPSPQPPPPAGPITLQTRAPPRWRGRGQGTPTGGPATPLGELGAQGGTGGMGGARMLPPGSAKPAAFVPFPPGDPRSRRPAGRPRTGLSQTR